MNRGIPKPLRDALGRQTASEVHPSPDVLTAFAEHSLPGRENQRVTDHLARCTDCREVVFLASSAIEEPVGEEQEWMHEAAVPRISPALQAKNLASRTMASAGPAYEKPRRGWVWRWAWVPAVAAVLIVAGVILKRSEFRPAPVAIASKGAPPVSPVSPPTPAVAPVPESEPRPALESSTTLEAKKPVAKPTRPQANPALASDALAAANTSPNVPEAASSSKGTIAPSVGGFAAKSLAAAAAAPPPPQNAFVESETQGTSTSAFLAKPYAPSEAPPVTVRGLVPVHRQWHITPDGHLERWNPSGWTRVLAEDPTTFRVVSVIGDNVWAGGNGGALFHSADRGQNWRKEPLASPAGGETGAIISIRFDDAMHGVVTSDGGVRWSTSDGGVTWTKE